MIIKTSVRKYGDKKYIILTFIFQAFKMAIFLRWRRLLELIVSYQLLTSVNSSDEADQEEQHFVVVPESVEVNLGEDVVLRCVVRNQQGRVQWTKDGFALGFEREVPGYPRYSYLGDPAKGEHHLVINGTTLEDDGEYQCQVGPTGTTSALWAAANVTLAPSSIIVKGDREGKTVEGIQGQTLQLECVVKDGRPAPSVAWYRNGVLLDQELHTERLETSPNGRSWSVISHLFITPEAEDDGQQFTCRACIPPSPTPRRLWLPPSPFLSCTRQNPRSSAGTSPEVSLELGTSSHSPASLPGAILLRNSPGTRTASS
ncbi:kin of IRRE-like protein 2 isoform X2 [Macrobrachium nipponense]|uniref:kin of IRRE-like protein 2 isoform X2 n=1 Tax=Macrobrachium nipponense TaxID=159736 RepID=UPI0030C848EF